MSTLTVEVNPAATARMPNAPVTVFARSTNGMSALAIASVLSLKPTIEA